MVKFIIRRLLQAIPTFFGITILSYAILAAAPGDPVATLSFGPRTTPAQKVALARQLGVNDPLVVQYFRWLIGDDCWPVGRDLWPDFLPGVDDLCKFPKYERGKAVVDESGNPVMVNGTHKGILRGDFGRGFVAKQPALKVVMEKLPATAELGALSLLVGFVLGVPIGLLAAVWQGSAFDNFTRIMAVLFNAVPVFWLGLMLLLIFGSWLHLLPMGGRLPDSYFLTQKKDQPFIEDVKEFILPEGVTLSERAKRLILPVFVLATGWVAVFSRFMRAATLEVLNQDYIRTAKAKGLPDREVWFIHATRNALIPIATLLGPAIPGILGGAVITETIFSWPGIGRTAFLAVGQQDYPIIMATVVLASVTTIIGYLLSDILYAIIDPRIRLN